MASVITYNDFLKDTRCLTTEMLRYELISRGVQPAPSLTVKQEQLTRELFQEYSTGSLNFAPHVTIDVDLRDCSAILASFEADFLNPKTPNFVPVTEVRLKFLDSRLSRLVTSDISFQQAINMLKFNICKLRNKLNTCIPNANIGTSTNGQRLIPAIESLNDTFHSMSLITSDNNSTLRPSSNQTSNVLNSNIPTTHTISHNTVISNDTINTTPAHSHPIASTQPNIFQPIYASATSVPIHNIQTQPMQNFQMNPFVNIQQSPGYVAQQQHQHSNPYTQFAHSTINQNVPSFQSMYPQSNQNYNNDFKKVPVYKWNVHFSGETNSMDALDFIQLVQSFRKSRGVSERELFNSAAELFTGIAAKWFHSQTFENWWDIETQLISDFVSINYFDDLIDEIKARKQKPNEKIVHFFTIIENMCGRLRQPLLENEKIKIFKKNLLPAYRPHVALGTYTTVAQLKDACKILESSDVISINHFGISDKSNVSFTSSRTVQFSSANPHNNTNPSNNFQHRNSRYDNFANNNNNNSNNSRSRDNSNTSQNNYRNRSSSNPSRANGQSRFNSPYPRQQQQQQQQSSNSRNNSRSPYRQQSQNTNTRNRSHSPNTLNTNGNTQ